MKKAIILFTVFLFCGIVYAQIPEGAYKLKTYNGNEMQEMEVVKIIQDGYFSVGSKIINGNKFHSARGGEFTVNNGTYTQIQDFNTENPELVGKEINYQIKQEGDKITISDPINTWVWERISGNEDELTGHWVMNGRKRDGEISKFTPGDRRTIKILSGGRFQWVAFNSATLQFSGSGGGTYSTENGKYTENIEFFSRDDSRVGASLQFDFEVKDGEWHHSGKSSKGDDLYEIWSPYKEAYKK